MAYSGHSFTTKLVLTIVLLFLGIVPGLIALLIFSREAKNAQEATNYKIPGAQELIILNRAVFAILLILLVLLVLSFLIPLLTN